MNYQVYEPSEMLQPFVKCFWTLEAPAAETEERQRIVPDGCMEMIFHYGDLYRQYFPNGDHIIQPRCFVFGQISNYLEIAPTGVSAIFSVRFHPDGFVPFINLPLFQIEDRAVPLAELFGNEGIALSEAVLTAPDAQSRMMLIEQFLLSRLQTPQTADRITKDCVEVMLLSQGQLSVDDVADKLQVNRRQLERKFSSAIGMSPKQLLRVIRLQAAIKMLEKKQFTSLTSLAYENGYFDQAHFIKDFKDFTGVSPKQFYAQNLKMAALFASAG
jgi:AraC-like DNA-binding protein